MDKVYDIQSTFTNGLNYSSLKYMINSSILITKYDSYETSGGYPPTTLTLVFNDVLDSTEEDALAEIISNYVKLDKYIVGNIFNFVITKTSTNSREYINIGNMLYYGFYSVGKLSRFEFLTNLSGADCSYQIRIYDDTNHNIIAESDVLTNQNLALTTVSSISSLPIEKAVFLFLIRMVSNDSGKNFVSINSGIAYV